jgi:hypothetical protein
VSIELLRSLKLAPVIRLSAGKVENSGGSVEPIRSSSAEIDVDEISEVLGAARATIGQPGVNLASDILSHIVADAFDRIAFEDLDRAFDLACGDIDGPAAMNCGRYPFRRRRDRRCRSLPSRNTTYDQ